MHLLHFAGLPVVPGAVVAALDVLAHQRAMVAGHTAQNKAARDDVTLRSKPKLTVTLSTSLKHIADEDEQ